MTERADGGARAFPTLDGLRRAAGDLAPVELRRALDTAPLFTLADLA